MLFKGINGLTPLYMSYMFNFAANRENTRQCNRQVLTFTTRVRYTPVLHMCFTYALQVYELHV